LHGIWAGTDTNEPMMIGLYVGSAAVVFTLIGFRVVAEVRLSGRTPRPDVHEAGAPR
jgi:hypothetical protein